MEITACFVTPFGVSDFKFLPPALSVKATLPTLGSLQHKSAPHKSTGIPRSSKPLNFISKICKTKPGTMAAYSEQLKNERFTKIIFN